MKYLQIIIEYILIIFTIHIIAYLYNVTSIFEYTLIGLISGKLYLIFTYYHCSYEHNRRFYSLKAFVSSWIMTAISILIYLFLFKKGNETSRVVLSLWFSLMPIIVISQRKVFRSLNSKLFDMNSYENISIIGDENISEQLKKEINNSENNNYRINNIYNIADINECIKDGKKSLYSRLFIAGIENPINIIEPLSDSSVNIHLVPDLSKYNILYPSWYKIGNINVLSIQDTPFRHMSAFVKRLEDVILSILILLIISPALLITGILIKITSKGPIIFKQNRYGLNGKEFKVYKFRSMTVCENSKITQAVKNDSRITLIGSFIRKTSIDELPQFFNVLNGSMSIVGPRPHAVEHNEYFRKLIPYYMRRHIVKPGITGWAQVNGWRGITDTDDKIIKRTEHDMYYIRNWSLSLDIKIIILTIFKGFINKNAY